MSTATIDRPNGQASELIPVQASHPVSVSELQMTPALAMLFEQNMAARAWKAASLYANSSMVPGHFQGKPENCFIALQMAVRTGQDPFMLMQQMYVVKGRPGFFSAYVIGQLNVSGKIKGLVKFEFSGKPGTDEYGCTAWCIEKETGERIDGPKVDWRMVKAEGWNKPKGTEQSKWIGLSDLMFRYRAASYLIRTSFPEVLMGLQTKEELDDASFSVSQSQQAEKIDALLSVAPKQFTPDTSDIDLGEPESYAEVPEAKLTPEEIAEHESPFGPLTPEQWAEQFIAAVPAYSGKASVKEDGSRLKASLFAAVDHLPPALFERCAAQFATKNWPADFLTV